VSRGSKIQTSFHPRRQTRFTPLQARRASLPPFEFALMFSIKSKRHSDGGRCARNPNRGHKPPKGSARIAAKCLSPRHYAAVARETAATRNLESKFFPSVQRTISDVRHSYSKYVNNTIITGNALKMLIVLSTPRLRNVAARGTRLFFQSRLFQRGCPFQ